MYLIKDTITQQYNTAEDHIYILAEDEKNPVGFLGSEEEKSLDESFCVLSHRVSG